MPTCLRNSEFFRTFAAWKRCIRMSWQMPQEWVAIPSVVGWVVNAASWQNWGRVLAASCCRLARWHGCAGSTASICKIRKLLGLKRVKHFELNKHFEHCLAGHMVFAIYINQSSHCFNFIYIIILPLLFFSHKTMFKVFVQFKDLIIRWWKALSDTKSACKFTFCIAAGRMRRRPHEQMPSISPANAPKIDFLPFGG